MIRTNKSKKSKWPYIAERNAKLDNFFKYLGIGVVLTGSEDSPNIILFESNQSLACYVKNFEIIFLDKHTEGKEIYRCKLSEQPDLDKLTGWINSAEHRKMYTIALKGLELFICGHDADGSPVFGDYPIYYKTLDYVNETIDRLEINHMVDIRY